MGGTIYESDSKRLRREGREEMQPLLDEKDKHIDELERRVSELEALLANQSQAARN